MFVEGINTLNEQQDFEWIKKANWIHNMCVLQEMTEYKRYVNLECMSGETELKYNCPIS